MTSSPATAPSTRVRIEVVPPGDPRPVISGFRRAYPGASWMPKRLIITIDGPAGTGKSTVARGLAARLGVDFLDTGAMYRAAAVIAVDRLRVRTGPIDEATGRSIVKAVRAVDMHFDWTRDPPDLIVDGQSVMRRIREEDVTRVVSPIAGIAELRHVMVQRQREIAAVHQRLVTEGRDQGSAVFTDASVKFYLYASAEVRAKRRTEELRAKGLPADENRILTEIIERDRSDATRTVGPLVCPEGAERVDTSFLAIDQVIDELEHRVRLRVAPAELSADAADGNTEANGR